MAELEVKNHVKKIHKIVVKKDHSVLEKFKEVLLEIFIIVFAVSLSIWLHSWSEHKHEQKQVKNFLIGLKSDIQNDINDSKEMIENYHRLNTVFQSLSSLKKNKTYDQQKLIEQLSYIYKSSSLVPNDYRFAGFLSSGKIGDIENDSLSLNILQFYHDTILAVNTSDSVWISNQSKLRDYFENNINSSENLDEYVALLTTPKGKKMTQNLIPLPDIYTKYNNLISQGKIIINQINEEYDLKE